MRPQRRIRLSTPQKKLIVEQEKRLWVFFFGQVFIWKQVAVDVGKSHWRALRQLAGCGRRSG